MFGDIQVSFWLMQKKSNCFWHGRVVLEGSGKKGQGDACTTPPNFYEIYRRWSPNLKNFTHHTPTNKLKMNLFHFWYRPFVSSTHRRHTQQRKQLGADGQSSSHRPRLVVSRSTCPHLPPPPLREQLCNRYCSNKHTRYYSNKQTPRKQQREAV